MWTINGYTVKMAGVSSDGSIVILAHDPSQVQPWVTARMRHMDETSWSNGHYYFYSQQHEAFRDWMDRI